MYLATPLKSLKNLPLLRMAAILQQQILLLLLKYFSLHFFRNLAFLEIGTLFTKGLQCSTGLFLAWLVTESNKRPIKVTIFTD